MKKLFKNKSVLILAAILALGIFLRSFKIIETFGYGHDADLFSWIVKDILIDKHIRLIGQETSTAGIFIGPLFYYFLTPFYLLSGFDPIGSIFAALFVGVVTIVSYYLVFKKLFNNVTGLVAAFFQAASLNRIEFDRWIVPTVTVNLWCVWFLLAVFKITHGDFKYLILAGFLTGLIWHVHVALAPLLILIPLAIIFSKKIPSKKEIGLSVVGFIIPMLPFIVFESRHGFTQIQSFYLSFFHTPENLGVIYGGGKLDDVVRQSLGDNYLLNISMLLLLLVMPKLKIITWKMVILVYVWIASVIAFFTITKKLISEYYFENVRTIILMIIILAISCLINSPKKLLKLAGYLIIILTAAYSLYTIYNLPVSGNGYQARMKAVEYINENSTFNNYPCVSISHISRPGEDFGYRYLFWFKGMKLAKQLEGIPNYTIVHPYYLATESAKFRYGALNVIPPENEIILEDARAKCPEVDYNLTNPFWGFTK